MKIENLVEKDTVLDDDYLIVDGTDGTKKAKKSTLLSDVNSSMEALEINKLPITPVNYNTADQYRSGARAIYGEIRRDRGMAVGIEYQYDAGDKHFGAQMIISYSDGILLRKLSENVWGSWTTIA